MLVRLAALGWIVAAAVMSGVWAWQRRRPDPGIAMAMWPALVGALAVLYANLGDGEWARRSAIAWMMGSWGARLAVQEMYTRAAHPAQDGAGSRPLWFLQALAAAAMIASLPALLASLNPQPTLSIVELVACGLWVVGFAGETTADRQRLRYSTNPANQGLRCRAGLWRYADRPDRLFEGIIWLAFAMFGLAAVWPSQVA
jgi:steroid 5-alpha reductase family enzyme